LQPEFTLKFVTLAHERLCEDFQRCECGLGNAKLKQTEDEFSSFPLYQALPITLESQIMGHTSLMKHAIHLELQKISNLHQKPVFQHHTFKLKEFLHVCQQYINVWRQKA
jgi:hypothetical protein